MKIHLKGNANNPTSQMIPIEVIGQLVCQTSKGIEDMLTEMRGITKALNSVGEDIKEGIKQSKEGVSQSKKVVKMLEELDKTVGDLVKKLEEDDAGSNGE